MSPTTIQLDASKPTRDVDLRPAILRRIRAEAGRYFTEFDGSPIEVELVGTLRNRFSLIYRFRIRSGNHLRAILAKVPLDPGTAPRTGKAIADQTDRPRLAPLTPIHDEARFEHRALSDIDHYFCDLADPRFGTVRVLDFLHDPSAIVVEEVEGRSLRRLVSAALWSRTRSNQERSEAAMRNAGAWLANYHQMPAPDHSEVPYERLDDFIHKIVTFTDFLSDRGGEAEFFSTLASSIERIARAEMPQRFQLVTGHGDFAAHNILIGKSARVTVLDTLARWRVPRFEDLGYFLVTLVATPAQTSTGGLFTPRGLNRQLQRQFLEGYFDDGEVPWKAVRLFEMLCLLDKWASARHSQRRASGWRRGVKRARLVLQDRYFRRYATRLLNELKLSSRGEQR